MSTLVLESPLTKVDVAARSFLSKPRQLLIDGKWVNAATGKTFNVFDPATGDTIASVAGRRPRTLTSPSKPPARPSTVHGAN